MGMTTAPSAGIGVLGAAAAGPRLFFGEVGVMGVTNSFGVVGESLTGVIIDEPGAFVSGTGVVGRCNDGVGVHGVATNGWGVIGQSTGRPGVAGRSVTGVGVEARSDQSHALHAAAQQGVGVLADSIGNDGVLGRSRHAIGVEGTTEQGIAGVQGRSNRGYGVLGQSTGGVGVAGRAPTNAVQGWSTGTGAASIGVSGFAEKGAGVQGDSTTGFGVIGRSSGGWAGLFLGNVAVRGAFYVVGGPKSAAVEHPDGTTRALFCLESTESYFEDFGEVEFTGTSVKVGLEKAFGALVRRDGYQVFLTSYGPDSLYVRQRTREGFVIARVGRDGDPKRRVRVGYRIVARRADLKPERLPKVRLKLPGTKTRPLETRAARPRGRRTEAPVRLGDLGRLPNAPKVPSPDLKALSPKKRARARKR